MMSNIFKKIEEAMVAAAFAESGEHEYAGSLLKSGKTAHRKVLLSTDCPVVTGKVLDHALNLCKRLGSSLEVFQIIPAGIIESSPREFFEAGTRRLQALKSTLGPLGISYDFAIKESSLEEELRTIARNRRDILAVIIPVCEGNKRDRDSFTAAMGRLFNCPVIFFES
jgi:hypothetical protein